MLFENREYESAPQDTSGHESACMTLRSERSMQAHSRGCQACSLDATCAFRVPHDAATFLAMRSEGQCSRSRERLMI